MPDLLRDFVAALPGGVLRGLDLLPTLAAQDADEAAHSVLLPSGGFLRFRLHHRDHLSILVGSRFCGAPNLPVIRSL